MEYQVFVESKFVSRLKSADPLVQAEIFFFKSLLEEHGLSAAKIPGYSVALARDDVSGQFVVWLKGRSGWTPLWLVFIEALTIIVCDREPPG